MNVVSETEVDNYIYTRKFNIGGNCVTEKYIGYRKDLKNLSVGDIVFTDSKFRFCIGSIKYPELNNEIVTSITRDKIVANNHSYDKDTLICDDVSAYYICCFKRD